MLMSMSMLELLREAVLCLLCERRREGATKLVFGRSVISHYLQQASLSLLRHSELALVGLGMTEKGNNSGYYIQTASQKQLFKAERKDQ